MKREIKFRGKNYGGIWLYGYLMPAEKPVINKGCKYRISVSPQSCAGKDKMVYEIISDTIGQYTGLKDKNGKEIYEGDIVCANHFFVRYDGYTPKSIRNAYNIEIDQKGLVTSVLYSRNYAIEFYPNKGWIMRNGSDQHRMHSIKGEANIEVIGYIHDNPEMLNTSE